ncbi:hypothetical protein RRG08_057982 [Elysia crispata]|uniref:Reverse transcriptase domain-containing protein n=1 Tax=Elysia crispata TaxID=231223 RepID=A0AAE1DXI1_9GAST|nr:hypothetical protein RRG08_057982 [Elysia crispata]
MSSRYGMLGTIQYDGSFSDPLPIKSGVKQGCVLAPTLFGIFFSLLLRYAFHESEDGIFLLRYAFISQKMVSSSTFHESEDGIFLLRYAFISQKMVSSSTFHESKDGIFLLRYAFISQKMVSSSCATPS